MSHLESTEIVRRLSCPPPFEFMGYSALSELVFVFVPPDNPYNYYNTECLQFKGAQVLDNSLSCKHCEALILDLFAVLSKACSFSVALSLPSTYPQA